MKQLLSTLMLLLAVSAIRAEPPRPLPHARFPDDKRLSPLLDLNGYFPFTPCTSKEAWQQRAERLRRQLLVATGLWPMPTKTPPETVIHGKVVRDGYTVEKVYLQSYPGHFVTGNLYRPRAGATYPRSRAGCRLCSRRTVTGLTGGFMMPAKRRSGATLSKVRSVSRSAAGIRSRRAACNWPAWDVSSSTTTWWATPTAPSCCTGRVSGRR